MKFGYFANVTNRHDRPFGVLMNEQIALAQYLDTHDWDSVWYTEHHFSYEGFEVVPNPVLMSTWTAAHTKRLRIGQAANIITFWHPLRFAEDIPNQPLAGLFVISGSVAPFPASILALSDVPLAVCSSFWHKISPFRQRTIP